MPLEIFDNCSWEESGNLLSYVYEKDGKRVTLFTMAASNLEDWKRKVS